MSALFFRSLILYIFLIVAMRLMGKRQVGELQVTDFVSTLLLSEIAATPIADPDIPLLYAIIPITLILSIEICTSFAANKSSLLKTILDGRPSVLISHGKLDQAELAKTRISIEELLSQLRQKNISSIEQVEYAILEQNGQMSVIEKSSERSVTMSSMNIETVENGIAHALILDGHISEENLKLANADRAWLENQLSAQKLKLENVFLFTLDDCKNINIIRKEKK
jgi:uncharacterized membrane protein YcaP (DUF421 family)